jgi:hypothetical protein
LNRCQFGVGFNLLQAANIYNLSINAFDRLDDRFADNAGVDRCVNDVSNSLIIAFFADDNRDVVNRIDGNLKNNVFPLPQNPIFPGSWLFQWDLFQSSLEQVMTEQKLIFGL